LSYTRRLWQAGKTRILPLNYTRNLS